MVENIEIYWKHIFQPSLKISTLTENAEGVTLPLHYLKEKFGVLTLFEVMSSLENRQFSPEEYRRHIRSSHTGWEYRYGIYLDDGWVYVYRNRGSTQR